MTITRNRGCTKHIKSIYITTIPILIIITLCAAVLWVLQRDMNVLNYHTIAQKSAFLSKLLYSNEYNKTMHKNNWEYAYNDAYSDIFYHNKHITNRSNTIDEIQRVHSMWWNYERFPMIPFTQCEEKYVGYKQNTPKRSGDLTFNNNKSFKILCINNDTTNDLRHSHIECYNTKFKGSTYICSFKNIYAYIDNNNHLKFKSFCKDIHNKAIFNGIKQTYKSSTNNHFPLHIDIINDANATNIQRVENAKYLDLNNIWFYDNDKQCESHKNGDAEHIGNPWHCLGHLEYWYRISKAKNISIHKHNLTLVMSQFSDTTFGPNVPIYHFYAPLFGNIINSGKINRVILENGDAEKNKLYYIKELFIDERSAKGWGAATIWQPKPQHTFFDDKDCSDTKHLRRSHIYYDLRQDLMNYYELTYEYARYNWIEEIKSIQNVNAWDIHGDIEHVVHGGDRESKLIVVATRYLNGICRYRCIKNMREIKDAIIDIFGDEYIVIYGNPGTLTFQAQYHLFKNTRIFVGVHGAVFLMASLFMSPQNLKFELMIQRSSEMVVRFFSEDTSVAYGKFVCGHCESKRGMKTSNVNVENVINELKNTMRSVYNISL